MEELLMIRSSIVSPGSTAITSGSESVRSLARKASYFTSLRSGFPPAMPGIPAIPGLVGLAGIRIMPLSAMPGM